MPAASESLPTAVAGPTRVSQAAVRIGRVLGRIDLLLGRIRPWMVLGPLVIASWAVMYAVAKDALHHGWLYYNGGDGTWYYTTAWALGHGHIPISQIGYGYSLLIAPLALICGPSILGGLPSIIVFNALVLSPIALLCIYGLAKAIGGQRFAYIASAIWVIAPLAAIPYFLADYHHRYVDLTLPAVVGLTPLGDFPSMVFLLVAAYFTFRALAARSSIDALTAGLAAGFAIAVKPANFIFLPAPFIALILSRRPRETAAVAAGLVPALIGLALWKYRGLGELPAFRSATSVQALGHMVAPPLASSIDLGKYVNFNWSRLSSNLDGLREFTWSKRMIMWVVLAGLIGLGRRSLALAALMAVWIASYLVLKGGTVATIYGGSFFRYMAPAFPAVFLLALSVVFLVPIAGRKLAARGDISGWPASQRARRTVVGILGALGVVPILLFLVLQPLRTPATVGVPDAASGVLLPANQFALKATRQGGDVTLTWPRQSAHGGRIAYAVFRVPAGQSECSLPPHAAIQCAYPYPPTTSVKSAKWIDQPPPGRWTYRVAVMANPFGLPAKGDFVLFSKELAVTVH